MVVGGFSGEWRQKSSTEATYHQKEIAFGELTEKGIKFKFVAGDKLELDYGFEFRDFQTVKGPNGEIDNPANQDAVTKISSTADGSIQTFKPTEKMLTEYNKTAIGGTFVWNFTLVRKDKGEWKA